MNAKRYIIVAAMRICLVLLAVFIFVAGPSSVSASSASPSPSPSETATASPSPSPTATPTPPASAATVAKARQARKTTVRVRAKLAKVRRCFEAKAPVKVKPAPRRSASEQTWKKYTRYLRHRTADWRAKIKAGRYRMLHPGGKSNGVRWMPLARWVGWPSRALNTLAGMIMCESSGRAKAFNTVIDCTGLTQIWPGHVTKWMKCSWSKAIRWLKVAENNLRQAYRIWKSQHGKFKPAWAGDPAVEAVE